MNYRHSISIYQYVGTLAPQYIWTQSDCSIETVLNKYRHCTK